MSIRAGVAAWLTGLAVLSMLVEPRAVRQQPPAAACAERPAAVISAQIPPDVCIPDGFAGIAVDYFDDYSWRAFAALVWPAAAGRRGLPADDRPVTAPGPRVFDTYKPLWEIFHADGSAPAPFNEYEGSTYNPCGEAGAGDAMTIGSASGIDDIGQAGGGVLDGPLVAQNGRYVRTLTSFNRIAFDHIVRHRLYLRSALPEVPRPRPDRPVTEFPIGSVAIKSAWVNVEGLPAGLVKRLYTRAATVKRATGQGCARETMGLIGVHIAQKTPSRPQWIWSSFEQKDAVPPAWPDSPGAFLLHDGSQTPMPDANPLALTPLAPEPVRPFNVTRSRDAPILTPTDLTSFEYQRRLAGTPFQYYKLVVTQWPRLEGNQAAPIPATLDGTPANTFPGLGAFSAFANVTMETFNQKSVQTGCMNCHSRARLATDFLWSVFDHAYPAQLGPARSPVVTAR
ncbi:MAG: hypothetical protein IT184_12530 [Acidobacteria bacterium]|nr:hypothetical protein [Acidobacteriota bacterium]